MSQIKSSFEHWERGSGSSSKVSQKEAHEILSDQVNIPYSDQSESEQELKEDDIEIDQGSPDNAISPNSQSYRSATLSYEPKTPDNGQADQTFQSSLLGDSHQSLQYSHQSLEKSYNWDLNMSNSSSLLKSEFDVDGSTLRNFHGMSIQQKVPDDVLKSLFYEEKVLRERLEKLVVLHKQILSKGSSSKKVRENILNCFKSMTMLYQAIIELYEKGRQRKSSILILFKEWEKSKKDIMDKVDEIRDPDKGEGFRLKQLIEESNIVDDEIDDLEKRLKQLKEKKRVLNNEIIQSQSIIESRTSTHLEELENIESAEAETLRELNNEGLVNSSIVAKYTHTNSMFSSLLGRLSDFSNEKKLPNSAALMETIKRQLDSSKDSVSRYQNMEQIYGEGSLIWADTGHLLEGLETELSTIIKESKREPEASHTKEKLEKALKKTLTVLQERERTFTNISEELRVLLESEADTIGSSLKLLNNQPPLAPKEPSTLLQDKDRFSVSKALVSEPTVTSVSPPIAAPTVPGPSKAVSSINVSSTSTFGSTFKDKLIHDHKSYSKNKKRD